MAPKSSGPVASAKRKASSSDKHGDNKRAKKAKTITRPKHQKFDDDDERVASVDSDGSWSSDPGDGGAELERAKPVRPQRESKEKGKAGGKPADRGLSSPTGRP